MADHPAWYCTKRQIEVFEQIAIRNDRGHHPRVLAALEAKGLITASDETIPGRLPIKITRYFVPPTPHMQWCEWCAENVKEEL